jgi:hypothetical protein
MSKRINEIKRMIKMALRETPVLSAGQWKSISKLAEEASIIQQAENVSFLEAREINRQERE